jgi:hypothetical protein
VRRLFANNTYTGPREAYHPECGIVSMGGPGEEGSIQQQQLQQQANPNHNNLAQVAQNQILQAAMNSASGASSSAGAATGGAPVMDLASVLAKIQSLEKEKAAMRAQLEVTTSKLSKLQESKRAEMEQMMNSTISKWLENLNTSDAGAKEQPKEGLNRLVQSGDESGVWNVIACASSNWVSNVNQIEELTTQLNEYKEKERLLSGGIFQAEGSRISNSGVVPHPGVGEKRKLDGISHGHGATSGMGNDIWSEFQTMIMATGGNIGKDYGILVSGSRGDGGGQGMPA